MALSEQTCRVLQFASLGFHASVWEIFPALAAGAELLLASREDLLDPRRLEELMFNEQVEVATLPPALLAHL